MFDIESDISPLRGEYFPRDAMKGLSPQEASMMRSRYQDSRLSELKLMDSELRFQMNLETLRRSREKAAQEREMYNKLPAFFSDLKSTMDDPELTAPDKLMRVAEMGMYYPMLLSTNKAASTMLGSVTNVLGTQMNQQTLAEQQARKSQAHAASQVKSAIPDYDNAIKDLRSMSDKLEQSPISGAGPIGGASSTQSLTSADRVMLGAYAKQYLDYTDDEVNNMFQSQDDLGLLGSLLGQFAQRRGMLTDTTRNVNVVNKADTVPKGKFRSTQ